MPLLDHFQPPLNHDRHWKGFHSYWTAALVHQLNKSRLPPEYFAEPQITIGVSVEVDVATLEEANGAAGEAPGRGSGVATAVYAPPQPSIVFPVDFAGVETYEVQIFQQEGGLRLVGAIELVSPANKDRPAHREAFVRKCATYLQEGVSVVIVDVVTQRSGNFHAQMLDALAPDMPVTLNQPTDLYAAAYRAAAHGNEVRIEAWPHLLRIGQPLPTVPLWIAPDLPVPVDLDQSYLTTCDSLPKTALRRAELQVKRVTSERFC